MLARGNKEPASADIHFAYIAPVVSTRSATEFLITFLEIYNPKRRLSAVRAGIPLSGERSVALYRWHLMEEILQYQGFQVRIFHTVILGRILHHRRPHRVQVAMDWLLSQL